MPVQVINVPQIRALDWFLYQKTFKPFYGLTEFIIYCVCL